MATIENNEKTQKNARQLQLFETKTSALDTLVGVIQVMRQCTFGLPKENKLIFQHGPNGLMKVYVCFPSTSSL